MTPKGARKDKGQPRHGGEESARSGKRHLPPHQYERLLKIIALLQPRYYYCHQDLAKELEISTRTLQRDIQALRERRVFIRQERGGYRWPPKRGW